jgi:hypothetical protein
MAKEKECCFQVDKAEKDILSDGREVLCLQLIVTHEDGRQERIYDVIETQQKLDEFLSAIGLPPGSMKLIT